jgi:DNA-binding transcriptional LysR family regulator
LLERDMIAVRVADELRLVVIASRAYLEGHGRPKTPHDLLSVIQLPAMPPTKPTEPFETNLLRSAGAPWSCRSAAG